jgi:hypothetical protein
MPSTRGDKGIVTGRLEYWCQDESSLRSALVNGLGPRAKFNCCLVARAHLNDATLLGDGKERQSTAGVRCSQCGRAPVAAHGLGLELVAACHAVEAHIRSAVPHKVTRSVTVPKEDQACIRQW